LWIAAESAGAPTFTWTGSAACSAQIGYYSDPQNTMNIGVSVSGTTGTGSTSTHTSTGFNSDANNALAIYIDVAAANTGLATPSGWTEDSDTGSATDAGRTTFGNKAIASSGSASGNISVTGANAAWVQFQIELKGGAGASGFQVSKVGAGAFIEPPSGAAFSKAQAVAWLELNEFRSSKLDLLAWLDGSAPNGRRRMSLM
jgi:hypothetical protein